jgi:hypothetical protein
MLNSKRLNKYQDVTKMNKFTDTSEKGFQKYSTEIEISSALPNKLSENFAPSLSR